MTRKRPVELAISFTGGHSLRGRRLEATRPSDEDVERGLRNVVDVPGVVAGSGRGQDAAPVAVLGVGRVGIGPAVDVGQPAADGRQDGLGRARVPLVAAGAGEDVGRRFALHQQHHLVAGAAHLQHLIRLQRVLHADDMVDATRIVQVPVEFKDSNRLQNSRPN